MIKDIHNPNPKYFMLTEDDIIMPNDEYYDYTEDRWYEVNPKHVGDLYTGPYSYEHFLIIRRKNPDFTYQRDPWI